MKKVFALLFLFTLTHKASAKDIYIEIKANDHMQYSTKSFEVTEGQKVTLTLKNTGKIPVAAMGHNIVILKPGTMLPAFAAKCGNAKSTGYVPQDEESKKQIVAYSKLLGGGQSDVIHFVAPAPGKYPFFCSYPGHFAMMQGVMTVKAK